jgi:hypothetical protein
MSKTFHYYFDNLSCRSISNVRSVKVDTWIHLETEDGYWLVNPSHVNCVRVEEVKDDPT